MMSNPPYMLTPTSLTIVLAYFQYYTPKCLPRGRYIAATHLRNLALWIGRPSPDLLSLRRHPALATHIALLQAMDFLNNTGDKILPQPPVMQWLHLPPEETIQSLLDILVSPKWPSTLKGSKLDNIVTEDITVYLQQSLTRQLVTASSVAYKPIRWLETTSGQWVLDISVELPNWQQFDLRQLGHWSPGKPLVCTPLTIATATLRGYSPDAIQWLLENAHQEPLSIERQTQLQQWCRRANTYQIRTVRLLTTAQPAQTTQMMRYKRLRQAAIKQIAPRHIIVKDEMVEKLTTWLKKQGYPLDHDPPQVNTVNHTTLTNLQWQWLGVRVLIDLSTLLPLPYPAPHGFLEIVSQHLSETERTNLEATATAILDGLRQAIHGRDAFFPAHSPVTSESINRIQQAIERETPLAIYYQSLAEREPTYRQIQPLRLEKRGQLAYLTAYCLRAEATRTFRLDRIKQIE